MALTEKQKLFYVEYLIDCDATQAAVRAGYAPRTAAQTGRRLLQQAEVQAEAVMQEQIKEQVQRTEMTLDRVLKELEKVAFANAEDDTRSTLKYSTKLKALELIGKHLGMFINKLDVREDVDNPFEGMTTEQLMKLVGDEDEEY